MNANEIEITVGTPVELDNGRCEQLAACDDWDAADFRFADPIFRDRGIACKVEATGRTYQRRGGAFWVRGKVTWVGDGEPDTTCGCWIRDMRLA